MKKLLLIVFLLKLSIVTSQEKDIINNLDKFENTLYTNKDSALSYIKIATELSLKTRNNFQYSRCLYKLGYFYYLQNRTNEAISNSKKSIALCSSLNNFKTLSANYNLLGKIEMKSGNYNEALSYLLMSLKIAEKNKLALNTCNALTDLGNLYECQNNTTKALSYYLKNCQVAKQNNLKSNLLDSYNNIALLQRKSNREEALKNYNKALTIAKELNNEESLFNLYINLSEIYLVSSLEKSYSYLQMAKKKAKELGDSGKLFYVYFNLGGYYTQKKEFPSALDFYKKALSLSNNIADKEQIISLNEAISECYKLSGDYKNAYSYQKTFYLKQNELFTIEKNKAFNEIQTRYDVEKKNLKINLLIKERQIEQEKKERLFFISIVIFILLLLVLWFFKHRIKTQKLIQEKEHKLFEQEKISLEKDKELNRIYGEIKGQDNERNRLAKEIHDGIGGKLAFIKHSLYHINTKIENHEITENINHIDTLFKELRTVSHNLSSNYIKNKKIDELLVELKEEYQKNYGLKIELILFPDSIFDNIKFETKHHLYRIVQELLNNIIKHAYAKNVSINFTDNKENINLIIEDDGIGFSNKEFKGIGIKNIEERLTIINGKIEIESNINHGTTVIIDFKK